MSGDEAHGVKGEGLLHEDEDVEPLDLEELEQSYKDGDGWRWAVTFCLVDFVNRCVHGSGSMVYPAQPFLAKNLGVSIDTFTTANAYNIVPAMLGTLVSAYTFKQYVRSATAKMFAFFATSTFTGIVVFLVPVVRSFWLYVAISSVKSFLNCAWEVAGAGMLVYMMGPIHSRPFVMGHHFTIAVGFLLGPLIIHPFLPDGANKDASCQLGGKNATSSVEADLNEDEVNLYWPFGISAVAHVICGICYLLIIKLPWKMPVYSDPEPQPAKVETDKSNSSLIVVVVIMFYAVSCGSERLVQTMQFIFGMCGPLGLPPSTAVIADESYSTGFMIGRFLSMFLVEWLSPRRMVQISSTGCFLVACVLALKADESAFVLFASTFTFGFMVSWEFGAAFSWISEHVDVVGSAGSLFLLGCITGGSITASVSGTLFQHVSPLSVWYLNVACTCVQVAGFYLLDILFKRREADGYKKLSQEDSEVEILSNR